MAVAADYTAVAQQLYIAYFGRPADRSGLINMTNALAAANAPTTMDGLAAVATSNATVKSILTSFGSSTESSNLYGTGSDASFIVAIYNHVLNRDPLLAGLDFWTDALATGKMTRAQAAAQIMAAATKDGADATDAATVANKTTVATNFTVAIDTAAEVVAYSGAAAAQAARDMLSSVASTTDTTAFNTTVASVLDGLVHAADVGTTFTLTTGVNSFTGGAGDDIFIADNTTTAQFSAADTLNGGAGSDSLTIYGTGGGTTVAKLSNIEHVTLDSMADTGAWNLGAATGVTDVTVSRAAGAATVTVGAGVAVTLFSNADATKAQTVNYSATDTAATLKLDTVSVNTGVNTTVTGAALTTLNIVTSNAASSLGTLASAATIKTVNVTGDKNLTVVDALSANVTKVDATAFTGKLNIIAGNATDDGTSAVDLTVIGGSGDDTLSIIGVADTTETSVNGGAGNDIIKVSATQIASDAGDILNGGAGTDVLSINYGSTATALTTDLSGSVTGFESITLTSGTDAGAETFVFAEGTAKTGVGSFKIDGAEALDSFSITGLKAAATVTVSSNQVGVAAAINTDTTADTVSFVLDGTTLTGALTATNYETVNIASNKDSSNNTNSLASIAASAAKTVNLTGSAALVGGTITLASGSTFNAAAYTGDLTGVTFGASVKSYVGGTGKDQITLVAGDLKQGNTFAGGAGTDKLTVTASASQDMGILGLTGFETVALTTSGANVADFRNVTDLATLTVSTTAGTDDLTLNRLASTTQVTFHSAIDQVVTTINTGTTQKVGFDANVAVTSLTLDSGTTTLTVNSDDGDTTADEAMGSFTSISGTSLATINVTGLDRTNLGTLSTTVTKVDASAATGGLTVTASATATSIVGSQAADTITGGGAADTIEGGKGNDIINGGAGHDTIVFASTGALNGNDSLTVTFGSTASSDILNFKNFLSGGSVDQNAGAGTAIIAYSSAATTDVNIAGHVVTLADATGGGAVTAVNTAAAIAGLIQGSGNVFSLTSGGKAVVIAGESTGTNAGSYIYFVDDSLDGVAGTVSATDVVLVGTLGTNYDIDTILTTNFAFA